MKKTVLALRCFLGGILCFIGSFGFTENLIFTENNSIIKMTACIMLGITFNYFGCVLAVPDNDRSPDAIDLIFFALGIIFTGVFVHFLRNFFA